MLPAFPLAVAWMDVDPTGRRPLANMAAVGTMEPGIEIWDLDVSDSVEPVATLGGPLGEGEAAAEVDGGMDVDGGGKKVCVCGKGGGRGLAALRSMPESRTQVEAQNSTVSGPVAVQPTSLTLNLENEAEAAHPLHIKTFHDNRKGRSRRSKLPAPRSRSPCRIYPRINISWPQIPHNERRRRRRRARGRSRCAMAAMRTPCLGWRGTGSTAMCSPAAAPTQASR